MTAPSSPTVTPAVAAGKWVWPIKNHRIDAGFCDASYKTRFGYWHTGIDLNNRATSGNQDRGYGVYAAADGVVKYVAYKNAGGTWGPIIVLQHKLPNGTTVWTRYAHLQNVRVKLGQQVRAGERIAEIGLPATWGAGFPSHLHFDVLHTWPGKAGWWPTRNGSQSEVTRYCADPAAYLRARGAGEP